MGGDILTELVYTRRELCRTCYTCVRECPAKAIRIENGQAEVMSDRCIGCGNCTRVCSQGAKVYLKTGDRVEELLKGGKVAAMIAPSFPAEFYDMDSGQFTGMVRALGFSSVYEVAFGADLVADAYKELVDIRKTQYYISSDCPSIVNYIKYYHPNLIDNLAPLVSPMVAMARVVKQVESADTPVVFIGPCVAKKSESNEIDEVITFTELKELFNRKNIDASKIESSSFDPPLGGKGAIFPVARGLLQTAGINDDAVDGNILAAEGRILFQEAIKEFEAGLISDQHLELLCCKGCIMGPGMSEQGKYYNRRAHVSSYAREKLKSIDISSWKQWIRKFSNTNLSASFTPDDRRLLTPEEAEVERVLREMGKYVESDHLNCGACGYESCIDHAVAITKGLAEVEMCLPHTIEKLHDSVKDLALSNEKLSTMRQALKQSEKLAHMGQLSAGIAHELNNPLGVVIMYSNILLEECEKNDPLRGDLQLIAEQAGRCKSIVAGLLNFSRKNQVSHDFIDLRQLVRKSIESVIIPSGISIEFVDNLKDPEVMADMEQMTQVVSNLIKNSVDALGEEGVVRLKLDGDRDGEKDNVIIEVSDNGPGIPAEHLPKIFEPFFTTKSTGKGTGLGLATAYGIVKMHRGKIVVESETGNETKGRGTLFRITLPRQAGQT
ncbi:MAG: [Fe-Fe] hydrogenase large subunit C-terminal domain-containing protein [Bacteroidales bacterium]